MAGLSVSVTCLSPLSVAGLSVSVTRLSPLSVAGLSVSVTRLSAVCGWSVCLCDSSLFCLLLVYLSDFSVCASGWSVSLTCLAVPMAGLSDLSIHTSGWSVCLCDASVSAYGWLAVTRLPMAVSVVTRLSVSDSPVCLCLSLSVMTRPSVSAYGWLSL